jgi:tetratricopeptide (TPR) repeat protein
MFYNQLRYREAIAEFEAGRVLKDLPGFDFNIGRCYDRLGDYKRAVEYYQRYISSNPPDLDDVSARIELLTRRLKQQEPPPSPASPPSPPSSPPPPSQSPQPPPPSDANAGRGKRVAGLVIGVIGLGALAGGIASGVLAQNDSDALSRISKTDGTFDPATQRRGRTEQILEGTLLGIAGAAIVTGMVLYALGRRDAPKRASSMTASVSF